MFESMNRRIKELILGVMAVWAFAGHAASTVNPDPSHALTTDQINTINGDITLDETDLAIPCPSFDLVLARAYNSTSSASNTLGQGWTHSLDWSLATVSNTAYGSLAGMFKVLKTGDGQLYWFHQEVDGTFSSPQDSNLRLST